MREIAIFWGAFYVTLRKGLTKHTFVKVEKGLTYAIPFLFLWKKKKKMNNNSFPSGDGFVSGNHTTGHTKNYEKIVHHPSQPLGFGQSEMHNGWKDE